MLETLPRTRGDCCQSPLATPKHPGSGGGSSSSSSSSSSSVVPPGWSLPLCLYRLGCRLPPQRIQRTKPNPSLGLDPGGGNTPFLPPPLIFTCCIIFCGRSCGRQSHWGRSSVAACLALEGCKCYKDNWVCQQSLCDLVGVS